MTIRMDEAEVIAAAVGTGLFALLAFIVGAWLLYRLVRPSRRRTRRENRRVQESGFTPEEVEQMLRLMERMEQRLEVLERVVAQDERREERILEAGEDPELRRIK
jgi:hypothetical protein